MGGELSVGGVTCEIIVPGSIILKGSRIFCDLVVVYRLAHVGRPGAHKVA